MKKERDEQGNNIFTHLEVLDQVKKHCITFGHFRRDGKCGELLRRTSFGLDWKLRDKNKWSPAPIVSIDWCKAFRPIKTLCEILSSSFDCRRMTCAPQKSRLRFSVCVPLSSPTYFWRGTVMTKNTVHRSRLGKKDEDVQHSTAFL